MAEKDKKPTETAAADVADTAATSSVPATATPKQKSKLKEVDKPQEGTIVSMAKLDSNGGRTTNYIWVEGTGESRHMPKGKKFEVQELHGQRLIDKGCAKLTTPPPKPQPKPAGKKKQDDDEDDD